MEFRKNPPIVRCQVRRGPMGISAVFRAFFCAALLGSPLFYSSSAFSVEQLPEVPFDVAIRKRLSGIRYEKIDKAFVEQAIRYAEYVGSGKRASSEQRLANACRSGKSSPFCGEIRSGRTPASLSSQDPKLAKAGEQLAGSPLFSSVEEEEDEFAAVDPPKKDAMIRAFKSGELPVFAGADQRSVLRALKGLSFQDVAPVVQASLESVQCPNPELLGALALKSEEFFPDAARQKDARELYARALSCAPKDTEETDRLRYRLSLLHLMQGDCRLAEPQLYRLTEDRVGEYTPRALYWRSNCAKKQGNKMMQSALEGRLLRDYPLTYQALLVSHGRPIDSVRLSTVLSAPMPRVIFRSQLRPDLNDRVRGAEVLLDRGYPGAAGIQLSRLHKDLASAEPAFRLYVGILFERASDQIGQFRAMSSAFRDDPSTMARATMEFFYPLKRFDLLQFHKGKVDPYLAASLIRQESGFNERARSPVGAMGLMQLMPSTARLLERVSKQELFDPKTNIRLGVKYFAQLRERFGGDVEFALAGYNAGPERVDSWRRRYPVEDRILFLDLIPFKETRDYVALIARNYYWYLNLYEVGGARLSRTQSVFTAFNHL